MSNVYFSSEVDGLFAFHIAPLLKSTGRGQRTIELIRLCLGNNWLPNLSSQGLNAAV